MHLDLSDEEADALAQELHDIVECDRYPLSPRIQALRAILGKLRPEPARKPLPPLKHYEPSVFTEIIWADLWFHCRFWMSPYMDYRLR